MKYKLPLFVLIILCASLIQAQELWSLEKCTGYALTNNIQIKQQQLNVELSKEDLLQSKGNLFPDLNANATHVYNFGQTVDRYTNTFANTRVQSNNFYLSSNLVLFNGLQSFNNIRKNRLDLQASRYDLDKIKDDISLQIATYYLNILFNIELLNVAESQVEITKQQLERSRKLVEAGADNKGKQLTIEAQLASEEMQVVDAQNQLDLSYLMLTQLLDLPSPKGFDIERPEIDITRENLELITPELVFNTAVTNRSEIKSSEIKMKSSKLTVDMAKGALSPSLMISGSIGTGYSEARQDYNGMRSTGINDTLGSINIGGSDYYIVSPGQEILYKKTSFGTQLKDNLNESVGLYLSIPLFNRLQTKNQISKAKIAWKNAEYTLELNKIQLNKTIQQSYADATAAFKRFQAAQKSVEALKESFNYAEQRFNVGMLNPTDYNDAKNKLTKARSDLLQAKYNYVFRKKILDFYYGKPLTLKQSQ